MIPRKHLQILSLFLLVFLVSCQNNSKQQNESQLNSPKVPLPEAVDAPAETTSPEAVDAPAETISPEAVDAPAETISPEAVDAPAETISPEATSNENQLNNNIFVRAEKIKFQCGIKQNFLTLEISSECPVDEDKDGRPDREYSTVEFSNPEKQEIYVTYPDYMDNNVYNTAIIKTNEKIKFEIDNKSFNSTTQSFPYTLGLGRVHIPASDTFSENLLSCQKEISGTEKKKFGVVYSLKCEQNQTLLNIHNAAAGKRAVVVKYSKDGVEWIRSIRDPYHLALSLPNTDSYQIDILIPEP
ncbi:hypothetical protein [Chroococcidiopsis sp. CCNUC1]|uniref:hypothetical protein n=1 Tax=Chroococcidiopsis sp. CCNUC1 TaxID=2653189 RepID=UPI0020219DBA|nr:hypothetical protein [Chroococcidiopsis sp. CCNUC1]URD48485.1 hypothetical protein M5J74_19335 [Chroococcidiopsis sp. CCNUC1]